MAVLSVWTDFRTNDFVIRARFVRHSAETFIYSFLLREIIGHSMCTNLTQWWEKTVPYALIVLLILNIELFQSWWGSTRYWPLLLDRKFQSRNRNKEGMEGVRASNGARRGKKWGGQIVRLLLIIGEGANSSHPMKKLLEGCYPIIISSSRLLLLQGSEVAWLFHSEFD